MAHFLRKVNQFPKQPQVPSDAEKDLSGYHCYTDTLHARFYSIDTETSLVFITRLMMRERIEVSWKQEERQR